MQKLLPTLSNIIADPSVYGGPKVYKDIRVKNKYNQKFNNYIQKHKLIPFNSYYKKDGSQYIFHFRITSDSDENVIYDVVLEFIAPNKDVQEEENLNNYIVKIFSNSPGFIFQFAYVYNKRKLIACDLNDKLGETALSTPPSKSNPNNAVGYDYTVYFALYYLSIHNFYMAKKQIMGTGEEIHRFDPDVILNATDVLEKRTPSQLNSIEKIGKKIKKTLVDEPVKAITKIGHKLGIISPTKAKKASRSKGAKKAIKSKKF